MTCTITLCYLKEYAMETNKCFYNILALLKELKPVYIHIHVRFFYQKMSGPFFSPEFTDILHNEAVNVKRYTYRSICFPTAMETSWKKD